MYEQLVSPETMIHSNVMTELRRCILLKSITAFKKMQITTGEKNNKHAKAINTGCESEWNTLPKTQITSQVCFWGLFPLHPASILQAWMYSFMCMHSCTLVPMIVLKTDNRQPNKTWAEQAVVLLGVLTSVSLLGSKEYFWDLERC